MNRTSVANATCPPHRLTGHLGGPLFYSLLSAFHDFLAPQPSGESMKKDRDERIHRRAELAVDLRIYDDTLIPDVTPALEHLGAFENRFLGPKVEKWAAEVTGISVDMIRRSRRNRRGNTRDP